MGWQDQDAKWCPGELVGLVSTLSEACRGQWWAVDIYG